jgi:hypothetical protein
VSIIGKDVPIQSHARARCRDYIDVLHLMPRNAAKRFSKLTTFKPPIAPERPARPISAHQNG